MENQVKIAGLLYVIIGGLGAVAGLIYFEFFAGPAPGTEYSPVLGIAVTAVIVAMLVLALPMIVIGAGLLRFRPWARWAGTILSIFSLLHFPLGTVTGIYALSVLLSPDTDPLFNPRFNKLYIRKP